MSPPRTYLPFRVFLLALAVGGALYYHQVASRRARLEKLVSEERSILAALDGGEQIDLDALRGEVHARRAALATDAGSGDLVASLSRTMRRHGLIEPVTRSGPVTESFGLVQSSYDIEFKGSFTSSAQLIRDLTRDNPAWRITQLNITSAAEHDASHLSGRLQIVAYSLGAEGGAE